MVCTDQMWAFLRISLNNSDGNLAPSLGEGQKNCSRTKMTFFFEKNFHFHGKNFWWLFLVTDQVFRIFTDFPDLYFVRCCTWPFVHDPFLLPHKKTPFFTLFILSRTSDNTTSQNIGRDECMGRPPPQTLGGPTPQSPLGFRPCLISIEVGAAQWIIGVVIISVSRNAFTDFWNVFNEIWVLTDKMHQIRYRQSQRYTTFKIYNVPRRRIA